VARASSWISVFKEFTKDVRIRSKEATAQDDDGVPLIMWESQKRYLTQLGKGLDDGIHNFIWLKGRQQGITTLSVVLDVFWLATHPNLEAALVTEHEGNREKNREAIRFCISKFPPGYFGDDFYILKGKDNIKMMGFSNGSSIRFLVAGTKKKSIAWAEGSGYALAHATEIASYYGSEGLSTFEESFAKSNPDRLFIYESTAKGMKNVMYDRWQKAQGDPLTWRANFIGWWANHHNSYPRGSAHFEAHGRQPRTREERDMIAQVQQTYDWEITPEQLCWYRWARANAKGEDSELFQQNNPSLATEAFISTGYSFFQMRLITRHLRGIQEDNPQDHMYAAYRYHYGDDFFDLKLEFLDPGQWEREEMDRVVELKVWEEPRDDGRYVVGMDPSYGTDHGDFAVVSVWRCYADCIEQVAEYATNKVEQVRTAWVLAHLAGAYRDCMINLEMSGGGTNVMQELDSLRGRLKSDMYADHVRTRDWEDALGWARWYLYHRPDSMGAGYLANFKAGYESKHTMMYGFQGSFATNQLVIHSVKLLYDMQNVRVDGNSIAAPESSSEDCKDDKVIGGALAHKAWTDWRRAEMIALGLTREKAREQDRGAVPKVAERVNNLVFRFLQTREQQALEASMNPVPTWREERGL
jgi:hypothetical protein